MKTLEIYNKLGKFVRIDKDYVYPTLSARIEVGVELLKDVESYEEYCALNELINQDVERLNWLKNKQERKHTWFKDSSERVINDEEIIIVILKNGQIGGHKIF